MEKMINLRRMTIDDVDAVTELERSCFADPWPRSAFAEMAVKKDADYFLAEDDETGEIVGGCALFDIVGEGNITNVAVRGDRRGQGIGYRLICYLLERGEERGIEEFTLEVRVSNAPAIRIYEKAGFHSEGIRPGFYSHPKEDGMIMWKRKADTAGA